MNPFASTRFVLFEKKLKIKALTPYQSEIIKAYNALYIHQIEIISKELSISTCSPAGIYKLAKSIGYI
jgi:hypothetical protein